MKDVAILDADQPEPIKKVSLLCGLSENKEALSSIIYQEWRNFIQIFFILYNARDKLVVFLKLYCKLDHVYVMRKLSDANMP